MRQLQWNSIREISVSIYYRQNYQAGFSQPAPPANWLHMLQRLFHTIMGCKKNALKFSSFLKKWENGANTGKISMSSSCFVPLLHSSPGLGLSEASQCWASFRHLPGKPPWSLLKSAVKHMYHLNFSRVWMLEFSKGKNCGLQLILFVWFQHRGKIGWYWSPLKTSQ